MVDVLLLRSLTGNDGFYYFPAELSIENENFLNLGPTISRE